jgi:hypothetical protein
MVPQSTDSNTWDQACRREEVEGPDMTKGRVEEAFEEGQGPYRAVTGGGGGGSGAEQNVLFAFTEFLEFAHRPVF